MCIGIWRKVKVKSWKSSWSCEQTKMMTRDTVSLCIIWSFTIFHRLKCEIEGSLIIIDRRRCCRHRHEFSSLLTATAVGTLTLGLSISDDFGLSLSDLAQKEAIELQAADAHGHSMTFPINPNISLHTDSRSCQIHVRLHA